MTVREGNGRLPGYTRLAMNLERFVAAPAFADIAKFDLQYLEVPPDAPQTVTGP